MHRHPIRHARTLALCALLSLGSAAGAQTTLSLFDGKPIAGARAMFGDADVLQPLAGERTRMTQDPKQPNAVIEARLGRGPDGPDGRDALGLRWHDAWMATLRIDSQPLDLRPYLADGVLSFDI